MVDLSGKNCALSSMESRVMSMRSKIGSTGVELAVYLASFLVFLGFSEILRVAEFVKFLRDNRAFSEKKYALSWSGFDDKFGGFLVDFWSKFILFIEVERKKKEFSMMRIKERVDKNREIQSITFRIEIF